LVYNLITIKDVVRVPPHRFGEPIDDVVLEIAREEFEERVDPDIGMLIAVLSVEEIGVGHIIPGDGGVYHTCIFKVLSFKPEIGELVEGEVVEVTDFGLFIRIGCTDALCHISQIHDDFFSFNPKQSALIGQESGQSIMREDRIRARIITLSLDRGIIKVAVTARQPGLGSFEWLSKWIEEMQELREKGISVETKKKPGKVKKVEKEKEKDKEKKKKKRKRRKKEEK